MPRALRILAKTICVLAIILVYSLGLMIAKAYLGGEITVCFVVPWARLTVDGTRSPGWVQRGIPGGELFVTLDDPHHRQSYWFFDSARGLPRYRLHGCGPWTAPRAPVFTVGDYGPPCMLLEDNPPDRRLDVKPGRIEFNADDGRRVSVRW